MAVLDDIEQQLVDAEIKQKELLREERRRTGRYMAAGAAVFLSLISLYQAVVKGTPQYAALFAPAIIMFIYILWILYASKNHLRIGNTNIENANENPDQPNEEALESSNLYNNCNSKNNNAIIYSRSYSIA